MSVKEPLVVYQYRALTGYPGKLFRLRYEEIDTTGLAGHFIPDQGTFNEVHSEVSARLSSSSKPIVKGPTAPVVVKPISRWNRFLRWAKNLTS